MLLALPQTTAPATTDSLSDWLTFVSSLIGTLAWPIAALILALVFRKSLRKLVDAFGDRVGQMTGIKLPGGFEASWPETLQHITGELKKTEDLEQESPAAQSDDERERAQALREPTRQEANEAVANRPANPAEIALVSPPSSVIAAFLPVERAIREYLRAAGQATDGSLVRSFMRSARVPSSLKRAVSELSTLRNRAAHEPDLALSARDAIEYADAASRAVSQINRATDELLNP